MRTNIDLDDKLLSKAMKVLGTPTKKATVEEALRRTIEDDDLHRVIKGSAGIGWEGNLRAMREGWKLDDKK